MLGTVGCPRQRPKNRTLLGIIRTVSCAETRSAANDCAYHRAGKNISTKLLIMLLFQGGFGLRRNHQTFDYILIIPFKIHRIGINHWRIAFKQHARTRR